MGSAVGQSNATVTNSLWGTTTNYGTLTSKQQLLIALGNVGTQVGNNLAPIINMPATVTVKSGMGIGILFMKDLQLPANFATQPAASATANANGLGNIPLASTASGEQ